MRTIILEFSGLPPSETLTTVVPRDSSVLRVDPLDHDPRSGDSFTELIRVQSARLRDRDTIVAYCTGAALATQITNAAVEQGIEHLELLLIDPVSVLRTNAISILSRMWARYVVDADRARAEVADLFDIDRAAAVTATADLLAGRVSAELVNMGLANNEADAMLRPLVRRYEQWVSFLHWSHTVGAPVSRTGGLTIMQVDARRQSSWPGQPGAKVVRLSHNSKERYLSDPAVGMVLRKRLSYGT